MITNMIFAVEKKSLGLVASCIGTISLEPWTHLRNLSKGNLTAVNYRLFLKVKINYVMIFASKILSPKFLPQVYKSLFFFG